MPSPKASPVWALESRLKRERKHMERTLDVMYQEPVTQRYMDAYQDLMLKYNVLIAEMGQNIIRRKRSIESRKARETLLRRKSRDQRKSQAVPE